MQTGSSTISRPRCGCSCWQSTVPKLLVPARRAPEDQLLQTRVLTVQTSRIGGRVHVSVEDTGGGVSDADRERIFKALFTTKAGGMGIAAADAALSMVHVL
ncbi:MAG: ATP-binding protein [Xanthobacteraceae bacterium]